MATDALIGVQDMGAAGLTCSTCEMGSRGGAGVEIDVMHVPQRETGMTPYEIMLSESQERMLLVVKKGREAEVEAIFDKWDLHAAHIGEVTDRRPDAREGSRQGRRRDSQHRARRRGAGLRPPDRRGPPTSTRSARSTWRRCRRSRRRRRCCAARVADRREQALGLPAVRHDGADQHHRRGRPQRRRRPREGDRPRAGDRHRRQRPLLLPRIRAAARCWRSPKRRATSPAPARVPIGATNCLNFGNPERPEIMWQLVEAIEGIAEACRALDVPITGGNVSLYNETDGQAIYPTPIIGVVGADRRCVARPDAGVPGRAATPSCCSGKTAASSAAANT